jgi:hypothetical protein
MAKTTDIERIDPADLAISEEVAMETSLRAMYSQMLEQAQVDFLLQRTPKSEIKQRQGRGNMTYSYVEHGYVTERLNLIFGFNWDFEVVDKQILDDEVIVEAKLTVRTKDGQEIVKTQFGGAEVKRFGSGAKSGKPLSIADDYKAAASDALKKCATMLGIALDLYGRDRPYDDEAAPEPTPISQARRPQTNPTPIKPQAATSPANGGEAWDTLYAEVTAHCKALGCTDGVVKSFTDTLYSYIENAGTLDDVKACATAGQYIKSLNTTQQLIAFGNKMQRNMSQAPAEAD